MTSDDLGGRSKRPKCPFLIWRKNGHFPHYAPIQKSIFLHIFSLFASRYTFVPTQIVLKMGFLERKKATGQKWAKKYTVQCKELSPNN
jgi:hypothetical protein